ncbi:hypothetical protein D3C81_1022360 [compost metagenome]
MGLVDEGGVEVDAGLLHHLGRPGLALQRRHLRQAVDHLGLVDAALLGRQVHHVVAERLVRHHADMRVRVLVGSNPLRLAGAGLNVRLELAGLEQA